MFKATALSQIIVPQLQAVFRGELLTTEAQKKFSTENIVILCSNSIFKLLSSLFVTGNVPNTSDQFQNQIVSHMGWCTCRFTCHSNSLQIRTDDLTIRMQHPIFKIELQNKEHCFQTQDSNGFNIILILNQCPNTVGTKSTSQVKTLLNSD